MGEPVSPITINMGVTLGAVLSVGLDQCKMTRGRHDSVPQGIFTALWALPVHPSNAWQPLAIVLSPSRCLFQNIVWLDSYSMPPFRIVTRT